MLALVITQPQCPKVSSQVKVAEVEQNIHISARRWSDHSTRTLTSISLFALFEHFVLDQSRVVYQLVYPHKKYGSSQFSPSSIVF